jgi:hypothetical protein
MPVWDDIALEIAIIERLALESVRRKIASQQLGEAWTDLLHDLPENGSLVSGEPTLTG